MILLSKTGRRAGRSGRSKEPPAPRLIRISNPNIPELESDVTCCKQTTAHRSNRNISGAPRSGICPSRPACPDAGRDAGTAQPRDFSPPPPKSLHQPRSPNAAEEIAPEFEIEYQKRIRQDRHHRWQIGRAWCRERV